CDVVNRIVSSEYARIYRRQSAHVTDRATRNIRCVAIRQQQDPRQWPVCETFFQRSQRGAECGRSTIERQLVKIAGRLQTGVEKVATDVKCRSERRLPVALIAAHERSHRVRTRSPRRGIADVQA